MKDVVLLCTDWTTWIGGKGGWTLLTHSAPEQYEEQSEGVEDVVGRHPEHELEIEGVELRDEEEDRDAEDRHPPLEARQRVPRELDPAVRRKLTNEGSVLNWDFDQ